MSNVNEVHPQEIEETSLIPVCSQCGEIIMQQLTETRTLSDGSKQAYMVVSGTFIVALDGDGKEVGPRWGFCLPCVESGKKRLPIEYLGK